MPKIAGAPASFAVPVLFSPSIQFSTACTFRLS